MSNDENQDNTDAPPTEPTITYEVFEAYHKSNPDLDNSEYYKAFPTVKEGTIRYWKSKARTPPTEPTPTTATKPDEVILGLQKQLLDTLIAGADVKAQALAKPFIDKGDLDSAILLLQENAKIQKPLPNTGSVPTPTGTPQLGMAKYMKYNPGSEKITWEIPASVMLDPKKNKELGEYH